MIEATNMMLVITIVLSVWASVSWMGVSRRRKLWRLDGQTVPETGDATFATQLLVLILFVDALAAIFALRAWWSPG